MKTKLKLAAVIPARMGSSRFPGKPLAPMLGLPMIAHVYHRVALCEKLDAVYVATCDDEIIDAVTAFGGKAIMTSPEHERASDRVAEAAQNIDADVIVMVQGDEPMLVPEMIEQSVAPFLNDPTVQCVNLAKRILNEDEYASPNTIKVVVAANGDALYFSREPIPTAQIMDFEKLSVYKQVCIIPFTRELLLTYAALEPTPLEKSESIDMLRFLEHGYKVRMVETEFETYAVDTQEDLLRVENILKNDPFVKQYRKP
jgi:3-deoxy-manno-octulosonate cytidylyltransferase (CMP-KDO synthetase)